MTGQAPKPECGGRDQLREDARILRQAAAVMRKRSTKPRSLMLRVLCLVLENAAGGFDSQAGEP